MTAVIIHTVTEATRHGISFIHQELNVLDNLDIAANVFLGREPRRGGFLRLVDTRRMQEQAGASLKRLGLEIPTTTVRNARKKTSCTSRWASAPPDQRVN